MSRIVLSDAEYSVSQISRLTKKFVYRFADRGVVFRNELIGLDTGGAGGFNGDGL